jgi:hypothetical protein
VVFFVFKSDPTGEKVPQQSGGLMRGVMSVRGLVAKVPCH